MKKGISAEDENVLAQFPDFILVQQKLLALAQLPIRDSKEIKIFFESLMQMAENAAAPQPILNIDAVVAQLYFSSVTSIEKILDAFSTYFREQRTEIAIDDLLAHPTVFPHIISHLQSNYSPQWGRMQMTIWLWILVSSAMLPKVFTKILSEHSDKIDFNADIPQQDKSATLRYSDLLLLCNPTMLPLVIQKIGRENLDLDHIAILRESSFEESKAFIDFTLEQKEYNLLRTALLCEENGVIAEKISVNYLIEKHHKILHYLIEKLGISEMMQCLMLRPQDFSSAQSLEMIFVHYHAQIVEHSEWYSIVGAVIKKSPQHFIEASNEMLNYYYNEDRVLKITQFALAHNLDNCFWNNPRIMGALTYYPSVFELTKTKIQLGLVLLYADFTREKSKSIWEWCLTQSDNIQVFSDCGWPNNNVLRNLQTVVQCYAKEEETVHKNIRSLLSDMIQFSKDFAVFTEGVRNQEFYSKYPYHRPEKTVTLEKLKSVWDNFSAENKKIFLNWKIGVNGDAPLVCSLQYNMDACAVMLVEQGFNYSEILEFQLQDKNDWRQEQKQALKEKLLYILAIINNEAGMVASYADENVFKRIVVASVTPNDYQKRAQCIIAQNLVQGYYPMDVIQKYNMSLEGLAVALNNHEPFIDFVLAKKEYSLLRYMLRPSETLTFAYLLANHAKILLYMLAKCGISSVASFLYLTDVSLSSPLFMKKLLSEDVAVVAQNREFLSLIQAEIKKDQNTFMDISIAVFNLLRAEKRMPFFVSNIMHLKLDFDYWNEEKIIALLQYFDETAFDLMKDKIQLAKIYFYDTNMDKLRHKNRWVATQPDNVHLFSQCYFPNVDDLKILRDNKWNCSDYEHKNIKESLSQAINFYEPFYNIVLNNLQEEHISKIEKELPSAHNENKKIFLNWKTKETGMTPLAYALQECNANLSMLLVQQGADPAAITQVSEMVFTSFKFAYQVCADYLLALADDPAGMAASITDEEVFKRIVENSLLSDACQKKNQNIILQNLINGHYRAYAKQEGEVALGNIMLIKDYTILPTAEMQKRTWQLIMLYAFELNVPAIFNRYAEMVTGLGDGTLGIFTAKSQDELLFQVCKKTKTLRSPMPRPISMEEEHIVLLFSDLSLSSREPIHQHNDNNIPVTYVKGPKK